MGIENYDNLESPIYKRNFAFNDIFVKYHTDDEWDCKVIFDVLANLDGNGQFIEQSDLEKLFNMMKDYDTNGDGKIDDGSNNTPNEFEGLSRELQQNTGNLLDTRLLKIALENLTQKTGNFDDYDEGIINGFPRNEFSNAIKNKYNDAETKNLKDIYRFFSDNKTSDGNYSDFDNSTMDRRSYINLGLMANQFLRNQSASSKSALTNMLNEMKRQAGGMLDGCTIQDLQNFLMIERDYALNKDSLEKFQVQGKNGFGYTTENGNQDEHLNIKIKDIYSDNYVSSQEYADFNRSANWSINASHDNKQLSGECFFDASILALSAIRDKDKLAEPVFNDIKGVASVTIAGIINPVTKKPITVELTYEEIAAKQYSGTRNQNSKILIYGMAVEKLYQSGIMQRVTNNGEGLKNEIFEKIKNTEKEYYDKIQTTISEFSQITDPKQKRAKFIELSNQIDEILNDPELQSYKTLLENIQELKEQMSYICVDSTPLATAIKELSTNPNSKIANNTLGKINEDLSKISSDITNLFKNVPFGKTEFEQLEQLEQSLKNFEDRYINEEASKNQDSRVIKILSDFENAKNKLNQIKNCNTIVGTINEFKNDSKNMDVRAALESHFRAVDTEASNAETQKKKNQALGNINNFLTELKALNSDELVIKNLIVSLEGIKEDLTNPDTEIIEIIEDDIEVVESETKRVCNSYGDQRTYIPLEESDIGSLLEQLSISLNSFRTKSDANTNSDAYENLLRESGKLVGVRTSRYYGSIGEGGHPEEILQLLTNNKIGTISPEKYNGQKGAVLSITWSESTRALAKDILGYDPGKEFGGHAVRIVSSDATTITIQDTNTGSSKKVSRELLNEIGASIAYVTETEIGTYI